MKIRLITFVFLFVALGLLVACGGKDVPTQKLAIQGLDIKFNLTTLIAKAGQPIELTYENKGSINHAFKIDGVVDEVKIRPGATHVFKFKIKQPGDYKFICAILGHEMVGMVGTLIVQP